MLGRWIYLICTLKNSGKLSIKWTEKQIQKSKTLKYLPPSAISILEYPQFPVLFDKKTKQMKNARRGKKYIFTYRARWINKASEISLRFEIIHTRAPPIHTRLCITHQRMDGQEINYFFCRRPRIRSRVVLQSAIKNHRKPPASLYSTIEITVYSIRAQKFTAPPPPPILPAIKSADALWHSSTLPINLILHRYRLPFYRYFAIFFFFLFFF